MRTFFPFRPPGKLHRGSRGSQIEIIYTTATQKFHFELCVESHSRWFFVLSLLLPAILLHCPLASFLSAGGNRGLFLLDECSVMYSFFYFLQAWEVNKPHIWLRTVALTARNAQLRFNDPFLFSKFIRIH